MRYILMLLFILSLSFSISSFPAQVLKVKGSAVLIDTDDDNIQIGKLYYLMSNGKKKGIVRIVKLKKDQALARLLKGKALANWTLKKRNIPIKKIKDRKLAIGFALGFNNNSSDVLFKNDSPRLDSYTGTSISSELLLDFKLHKKLYLRTSLGQQAFYSEDTSNTQCIKQNNTSKAVCKVDLTFTNLDIWPRYHFNKGKYNFWAGLGLGILFNPIPNSTTALNKEDLTTAIFMQAGAGIDILISNKIYVPLWLEYGLYPSSDTVKMNSISVYLGLARTIKFSK